MKANAFHHKRNQMLIILLSDYSVGVMLINGSV